MSVQLIVYPQSYDGTFNSISSSPTEFLVNGIAFSGMDSTNSYDTNTTPSGAASMIIALINQPPLVNTWQRFRTTFSGTPALPVVVSGDLILTAASTSTNSGVYQKLTNLVVGQDYTTTINSASVPSGKYQYGFFNSDNSVSVWATNNFSTASFNLTFTATDVSMTFALSYHNSSATTWTINDISIQPVGGINPSGDPTILGNGQVIVDLYEDEDLPLTLSVDDFKNVAEKVQSYSKAFNLPATKRNNKIFDQVFEVTRSDDGVIFNPYKKTQCVLKQDGFILFEGYLRLLDVTDKMGEISYNVNLYSEVVALADTLKDSAFRDLDFSELEHTYNYTNIRNSWQGILPVSPLPSGSFAGATGATATNVLRYPFVDWEHQYAFTNGGMPKLLNLESSFRPFISIKYLIDRIFEPTEFTYSSDFFSTTDFEKLYMDFNWGADNTPTQSVSNATNTFYCTNGQGTYFAGTSYTNFVLDNTGLAFFVFPTNYDSATNILTATTDNETYNISYNYKITNTDSVARNVEIRYLKNSTEFNYSGVITLAAGANYLYQGNLNISLDTGDTLEAQFKASSAGVVQQSIGGFGSPSFGTNVTFILGITNITTETILQTLRGELNQWDFLKGLITMFNLVTLPDEDNPNNIKIEPYKDVFLTSSDSVQLNWTDKVDVSEMKLTPLTDLNKKTIFKFVEDEDDYAFNQYKFDVGGWLYGSKKYNAGNEFNILDGEDEIIAEPFAASVIKPLEDNYPDLITPAIYSMNDDGTSEGFENSPRIMYNNGVKILSSTTYSVPEQNGVGGDAFEDEFLQFSHLTDVPTIVTTPPASTDTTDFNFGECQLMTGVGNATPNNLFNTYWLPYYSELYNPNTRTMTIKVNLSPADISEFKFNDTVFIKNRVFRVNKIDYKPNDLATVEFILIP